MILGHFLVTQTKRLLAVCVYLAAASFMVKERGREKEKGIETKEEQTWSYLAGGY